MTRRQSTIGLIAAALVLVVTAVTTQAQPQFAGTWTLDPAQSQFPAREGHGHKAPDGALTQAPTQPPVVKLVVEVVTRRSPPRVALVTVLPRRPCSVRSVPSATNDWL